ncbi:MAG: hypothetical protein J5685_06355 [Clostridiales bacterium]|nr:hypothetical protein [Clostridiales bacterium]
MKSLFFLLSGEPMIDCGHSIDMDTVPTLLHDTYGVECDYVYLMKEDEAHWMAIRDTLEDICAVDPEEKTLTIRDKRAFLERDGETVDPHGQDCIGFYFFDTKAFRYDKRFVLYSLEELLDAHSDGDVFFIGSVFVCKGPSKNTRMVKARK